MSTLRTALLRYGAAELAVRTREHGHLEWLAECLSPAVRWGPDCGDSGCQRHVEFQADAGTFARWQARGPHASAAMLSAIDRDAGRVIWPRWNGDADEVMAYDPEFRVFVQIRSHQVVVLASDARPWTRVAWLRVIRQILMESVTASNALFAHAAAFCWDGRIVLVAGPKRAGKTSLLVHCLHVRGTQFVANDRVSLQPVAKEIAVRAMPTLVNVRPGTRAFFPGVFDAADAGPDTGCFTSAERRLGLAPPAVPGSAKDMTLLPAQFAAATGATLSAGGTLGVVLFPTLDSASHGVRLEALDAAEAQRAWEGAAFGGGGETGASVFGGRCVAADDMRRAWSWLRAANLPLLRCRLGPQAYASSPEQLRKDLSTWMV